MSCKLLPEESFRLDAWSKWRGSRFGRRSTALDADGYRTRAYRKGDRAERSPDLEHADCIVLDQILPQEAGLTFIARLRRRGLHSPAILIPSVPPLHVRLQALEMGVHLVEKPLLDDALFAAVRAAVRTHSAGPVG